MKKRIFVLLGAFSLGLLLSACGSDASTETTTQATTAVSAETTAKTETDAQADNAADSESEGSKENKVIKIGASPSPHAEILEIAKEKLAKEGYDLDIIEYTDYVQPNVALSTGELDANYFQHLPYLEDFNKEKGTNLVSAGAIHYEPFGIYAGNTASLDELSDGAKVAVPNDTTNEARALLLLADQGLITVKDGVGLSATKNDIVDNPLNLDIIEIEAAQIPRSLGDVDIAVINGNYAIQAGLSVKDALAIEAADSVAATTYGNIIAVRAGDENTEAIKALIDALQSDEVYTFIDEKYEGAVVPLF